MIVITPRIYCDEWTEVIVMNLEKEDEKPEK